MRNPPPPSESGPYQDPYSPYGHPERPYQAPHTAPPFSYPHLPHHDRGPHGTYTGPPPPPQPYTSQRDLIRMSSAPLDVSQPSAGQANSLYHQEASARDRYPPEGYYPTQPPPMRPYVRVSPWHLATLARISHVRQRKPGGCQADCQKGVPALVPQGPQYSGSQHSLDYLHKRRQELLSQLEERKVISPPPFAASPTLPHPFPSDYAPEVSARSR